jgi:hypothetical protein
MTHEILPHGRIRFTRADGSVWLFRVAGVREVALAMPLPTPKVVVGEVAEGEEAPLESLPPAAQRAKLIANTEATAALLEATSVSPKIVADSETILDGADAAYLCELGMDAHRIANVILRASGYEGEKLRPFPGDGEPGTGGLGGAEVRDTATPSDAAEPGGVAT